VRRRDGGRASGIRLPTLAVGGRKRLEHGVADGGRRQGPIALSDEEKRLEMRH
jgi:hypothetical protein